MSNNNQSDTSNAAEKTAQPKKIIPVTIVSSKAVSAISAGGQTGGCCGGGSGNSHSHENSTPAQFKPAQATDGPSKSSSCCGSSHSHGDAQDDPRGLKEFEAMANKPSIRGFAAEMSDPHTSEPGEPLTMGGRPFPSPRKNLTYQILGSLAFLAMIVGLFFNSLNPVRVKVPDSMASKNLSPVNIESLPVQK